MPPLTTGGHPQANFGRKILAGSHRCHVIHIQLHLGILRRLMYLDAGKDTLKVNHQLAWQPIHVLVLWDLRNILWPRKPWLQTKKKVRPMRDLADLGNWKKTENIIFPFDCIIIWISISENISLSIDHLLLFCALFSPFYYELPIIMFPL